MTNEEIKKEVLHRVAVQKKKRQRILRVSASLGCVAVVALAGVGLMGSGVFDQTPPVSDTIAKTTAAASAAPTEQDVTTTTATVDTPATNTTTAGGMVVPTTTVTTVAPTTTAKPTTGKTEPPKTTTTTGTKDKLLITGVEVNDMYTGDDSGGIFKPGELSPLLEQAMEQYKDTDAVYAVMVAINPKYNQKLVDDLNEAVDALLQSDEMVKLAEEVQLAWEEYEAAGLKGSAGETFRSLSAQYNNRQHDFKLAYWQARADEAVEALAKLSDMELLSLYERQNEVSGKEEKAFLSYVLNAGYSTKQANGRPAYYGYAAILSADEILELSECGSYMFWLDSYDEEAYVDYVADD